jgi:toxin HigB-1
MPVLRVRRCIVAHRMSYYVFAMIRSWRNSVTRRFWEGERPNQFRSLDHEAAIDLLLALNVATSLQSLSPLKSVGLHKLTGDRKGQWAMTVNARWRICFEFRKGDAYEVEIVDYQKG